MSDYEWFSLINSGKNQLQKVIDTNRYTDRFGISLSEQDAKQLLEARMDRLRQEERIEFREGILPKLIFAFCDSPYIDQRNYKDTLEALQAMFYMYKNESLDELSDDELIEFMKTEFEGECQGSLEYLENTSLERFCRWIRSGRPSGDEDNEDQNEEEYGDGFEREEEWF